MSQKREIVSLTGFRFVAAFYVFLFHVQIRWPITTSTLGIRILNMGAIGMTLFFMLSGFVLAYNYGDGETRFRDYVINRFARIYPLYAVAAILTLPWLGVSVGDGSIGAIGKAAGQAVVLLGTQAFAIQAWFPPLFPFWNNGGSWSISVEVFCYLMLPLILRIFSRLSGRQIAYVAVACFAVGVLPGFVSKLFDEPQSKVFYAIPIFRLPEFTLGICASYAAQAGLGKRFGAISQLLAVAALIVALRVIGNKMPYSQLGYHWITLPVVGFLLLTLANGRGIIAKLLETRFFIWFGKISYSFYSLQFLVFFPAADHHDDFVSAVPALGNNLVFGVVIFTLILALAAIGHHFIEEPARRLILRRYRGRQASVGSSETASQTA